MGVGSSVGRAEFRFGFIRIPDQTTGEPVGPSTGSDLNRIRLTRPEPDPSTLPEVSGSGHGGDLWEARARDPLRFAWFRSEGQAATWVVHRAGPLRAARVGPTDPRAPQSGSLSP